MIHQTDAPDHLARLFDFIFDVGRVAVDLLTFGHLFAGPDPDHFAVLHDDLVDGLVQHVRPAVDGRQSGETLRQLSQAVHRVQVGGFAVAGQRIAETITRHEILSDLWSWSDK